MSAVAPTNLSLREISSAVRFTSTGTTVAPAKIVAACATIHAYEFSPRSPILAPGAYVCMMLTITAMSSVN